MHEHPRLHSPARRVLSASAAALVMALSLAAAPAHADHDDPLIPPGDLVAAANDTRSVGRCDFVIDSVDTQAGVFHGRLSAQVRPQNVLYVLSNKYTQLSCEVFNQGGALVASVFVQKNSAYIQRHTEQVTVHFSDGFLLCASVATVTGPGNVYSDGRCEDGS